MRSEFSPWLPQTVGVLTTAFSISPQDDLIGLADALLENLTMDDAQTVDAFAVRPLMGCAKACEMRQCHEASHEASHAAQS